MPLAPLRPSSVTLPGSSKSSRRMHPSVAPRTLLPMWSHAAPPRRLLGPYSLWRLLCRSRLVVPLEILPPLSLVFLPPVPRMGLLHPDKKSRCPSILALA